MSNNFDKIENAVAFGKYVLVEQLKREKTDTGIVIPDSVKDRGRSWFRVVSVGCEANDFHYMWNGEKREIKVGDAIVYFQGIKTYVAGKEYDSVPSNNIMGVIPAENL